MRELAIALAALVLVQAAWLAADHVLRLYMGDSMSFITSGAALGGVGGRSFFYSWTLHFLAFPRPSQLTILILQSLWSALSCLGLFAFLRYALPLGFGLSLGAALALSLEPAQVFMARMLMAETYGLLAMVCTLLVLARYLHTGRVRWFVLACLGGLAAASIRISLLPVVTGLCLLAPFLYACSQAMHGQHARARAVHVAAMLTVLVACHLGYTHAYGYAARQEPGYLANTGMMRIGLVAPLIRAEHFAGTGVSGDVLQEVGRPLHDFWERGHHIWEDDGLYRVIERHSRDPEHVARIVTRRAMLDDPIGLLSINLRTLSGYFDQGKRYWRMQDDIGVIPPDSRDLATIAELTGWDMRGASKRPSLARNYFAASWAWLAACLFGLAPLAIATFCIGWRRPARVQYMLLGLASLGLVASHLLFAHIISFRYLHPFPWFVLANLAVLASAVIPLFRPGSAGGARATAGTPSAGSPAAHG